MEYFQKVRSTVTKAVEQVGNVVAGNPALRLFEPGDLVGSAGPAHFWKIYKGKKRSNGQSVAVWVFERKQLTRVRHPRVLVVEHPLEEGRESFIFCTEPVIGSLANVLGHTDGLPQPASIHHKNYKLHDIEIRIGLKQVAEALSFLHVDAKMMHRNVSPASIILNEKGDFKLAGPDAAQFTKIPFFKDHRLDTVQTLESFMQHEQMVKIELLKKLPDMLIHFEKRLLVQKIRPCLTAEFSHPDLIPFILPALFYIIDLTDKEEFTTLVMPELAPVFSMERPYQITILLLEKLDLFLSRADPKDVDNHILPCLYRAIKNENGRIQEICLNVVPKIAKLISRHNMKTDVLPRLLALATTGDTLAVRGVLREKG
ncbi:unnamed protein product, partial [Mesorhabditis spiculigera]